MFFSSWIARSTACWAKLLADVSCNKLNYISIGEVVLMPLSFAKQPNFIHKNKATYWIKMMWNQHTITLTCCNWVQYLLPRRFSLLDCCCHFLILHLIAPKNKANFRGVEKTAPLHECISKFMCVQNIAWSLSTRLYIVLFLFFFIKKHDKYTHDTKKNMQHTKSEHKTQTILSVEMTLRGVLIKSNEWRKILQKLVSTYTLRPFCQAYENITQKQAI